MYLVFLLLHIYNMKKYFSVFSTFFLVCSIAFAQEKRITLLHTSDEHSTLTPTPLTEYNLEVKDPTLGGFARLATKYQQVKDAKGQNPVLLLSAGDIMGGTPFAWLILNKKSFELDIMQKIGYHAMTIGNHEFDYGPDVLAEYFSRVGYASGQPEMAIINSNLNIPDKLPLKKINILPYKIFELSNGVKVGVFGIQGKSSFSLAPAAGDVTIFDQFESGNKTVAELKSKGADIIVLLSHSGIEEDRVMAKKIKDIDVILGGHDHIQTPKPEVVNNTIIVHPSFYLQYVGQLELGFDPNTKKVRLLNDELGISYLQALDSSIPEDSTIAAMIHQATDELNVYLKSYSGDRFQEISENVINTKFDVKKDAEFKETTIGNFIADAMRIKGSEATGERVDIAIQANGVIRGDILKGRNAWSNDQFALFDLLAIAGLGSGPDGSAGYPMVSCYLTEKEIFNVLEVTSMLSQVYGDNFFLQISGIKYTYDPGKSMWWKIPFTNTPIPATKAVKSVYLYQGDGIQDDSDQYIELKRDGTRLFHVVTDHYLAAFLPMVGEVLPKLEIKFKDKDGQTKKLDDCIVQFEGKEFKIWQSVAMYAQDLKDMPKAYEQTQNRIVKEEGIPLKVWTIAVLILIVVGIFLGIRKLLRLKRK